MRSVPSPVTRIPPHPSRGHPLPHRREGIRFTISQWGKGNLEFYTRSLRDTKGAGDERALQPCMPCAEGGNFGELKNSGEGVLI